MSTTPKPKRKKTGGGAPPSKYKADFCELIIGWGKEGYYPSQWASKLEVPQSTMENWKYRHPKFRIAWETAMTHQLATVLDRFQFDPNRNYKSVQMELNILHHLSEKKEEKAPEPVNINVNFGDNTVD